MKTHSSCLLLSSLLVLYLIARVLQLVADRVPHLLLVVLHVIPPALFALIHGARIYRVRGILVFVSLCLGVGTFFESMSLRTGFPFGHYWFTDLMGPKIAGLPILLAMAYAGMGYLAWVVSLVLLGEEDHPLSGRRVFLLPLLASIVMTSWDLSMEAVWAGIDRAWVWRDGGLYYGVPISNFCGWLLTTYAFYQLFAFYIRKRETVPSPAAHWLLAVLFYALSAVGNLFVIPPSSEGGIFIDASGRGWALTHILWTSRLVSLLVMLPFSVMAYRRISRPRAASPAA